MEIIHKKVCNKTKLTVCLRQTLKCLKNAIPQSITTMRHSILSRQRRRPPMLKNRDSINCNTRSKLIINQKK